MSHRKTDLGILCASKSAKVVLVCRERIMRSGRLLTVSGEYDLLAYYLLSGGADEPHDFIRPGGGAWQAGEVLQIDAGLYASLSQEPNYIAKGIADEISYAWDRLNRNFTRDILAGEAVAAFGKVPDVTEAEVAIRSMAVEPRLHRRLLAASFIDAMKTAEASKVDRYARAMLPGKHAADYSVAYIVVILAYHGDDIAEGYANYRIHRTNMVQAYCLHLLHQHRNLKRAVGIGIDASSKVTGRKGGSEDLVALEIDTWTPELEQKVNELRDAYKLMRPENILLSYASADEFPRQRGVDGLKPHHFRRMERAVRMALRRAARRQRRLLRTKKGRPS